MIMLTVSKFLHGNSLTIQKCRKKHQLLFAPPVTYFVLGGFFFSCREGVYWPFYLFQPLELIPRHGSVISSILDSIYMISRYRDIHYCPVPRVVDEAF